MSYFQEKLHDIFDKYGVYYYDVCIYFENVTHHFGFHTTHLQLNWDVEKKINDVVGYGAFNKYYADVNLYFMNMHVKYTTIYKNADIFEIICHPRCHQLDWCEPVY